MPNALLSAADAIGFEDPEEPTKVDPEAGTWRPERLPRPEDREIDRVVLRRPPSTGTAIDFRGPRALIEANAMIASWRRARNTEPNEVSFEIRFGDGLVFSGEVRLQDPYPKRDLRRKLRDPGAFARAFPGAADQVASLFRVFVSHYAIP